MLRATFASMTADLTNADNDDRFSCQFREGAGSIPFVIRLLANGEMQVACEGQNHRKNTAVIGMLCTPLALVSWIPLFSSSLSGILSTPADQA